VVNEQRGCFIRDANANIWRDAVGGAHVFAAWRDKCDALVMTTQFSVDGGWRLILWDILGGYGFLWALILPVTNKLSNG
jgi:hypothetical protein